MSNDLLITGIPRSGTTLAAALIDASADTVCLSEPSHQLDLLSKSISAIDFAERIADDYKRIRAVLVSGGDVLDRRTTDGKALSNYFSSDNEKVPRHSIYAETSRSHHDLSATFTLGMKHNALYTAALPELTALGCFTVIAIVRDPADAIASWLSLTLPVSFGRLPAAERYWREMNALTTQAIDLCEKQILICELFCARYLSLAPAVQLLRFEDFVHSPSLIRAAAGLAASDAKISVGPARTARTSAVTSAIRDQISTLGRRGLIPSILLCYPHYTSEA